MSNSDSIKISESKKSKKKNKSIIKFDEEIIKKDNATEVLKQERNTNSKSNNDIKHGVKQEYLNGELEEHTANSENISRTPGQKKKSRKNKIVEESDATQEIKNQEAMELDSDKIPNSDDGIGENEMIDSANPKIKTEESIRAKKRKKHAKLLEEKKLKTEVTSQQTALNYLSKWKHCRSEWKFEKLKQIWLSQNMFDCSKIPNEFWDTALEYFASSRGFIRKLVLREALKVIENQEKLEEDDISEDQQVKLQRARDIVQNLQE
ncbi:hypothetical protein JTB14_030740 [Gonioctena quinquepunctata]|nr:hypothetical protein JTB14_030740 [Gonioctena quinquepunctata]